MTDPVVDSAAASNPVVATTNSAEALSNAVDSIPNVVTKENLIEQLRQHVVLLQNEYNTILDNLKRLNITLGKLSVQISNELTRLKNTTNPQSIDSDKPVALVFSGEQRVYKSVVNIELPGATLIGGIVRTDISTEKLVSLIDMVKKTPGIEMRVYYGMNF